MDSVFWQTLSYITLSLGLLLLAVAAILAVRYKIFSLVLSEFRSKEATEMDMAPETPVSLEMPQLRETPSAAVNERKDTADESDNVTMVVAKKKPDKGDMTFVVSRKSSAVEKEDFRITRNILLINADPDVVDG